MTLENAIKSVLEQKLADGSVEKIVGEKVEQGIQAALNDLFGSYGDITKVIEKKLKEVMVPQIENHDFSRYLVKLDAVLTELSNVTAKQNKKLLDNFTILMNETPDKIKASEIFERWMKFSADDIEIEGLEVDYDDRPTYESVEVSLSFEQVEGRSWSSFENGQLIFECEHDEQLNFIVPLQRWKKLDDYWTITDLQNVDITSIKNISEFEAFIRSLKQNYTKIYVDTEYETDYLEPTAEPEASWS
ncbi:hypothetical protein [Lysinibacillus boronitolerans]|uniref:Phage protein n=1 Tax=Lysinibacillus boronitolerans JCM 21713 = 10a = NBRC 103108 TaxID=1294264 RepID=A0ABR4Y439_9BACI|nr:hypothetical protein [Lysinibacillus boronitolerans]KGR88839.1 hypothetical protein CD31_02320 [Lysinibacillus boronitolerans JCM 21713 = 10a = NBRC 103108]